MLPSLVLAGVGALANSCQLSLTKHVMKSPLANLNQFYIIKTVVMLLVFLVVFWVYQWVSNDGEPDMLSSRRLVVLTVLSGIAAIAAVYIYLVGLRYYDISHFAPLYSAVFILITVIASAVFLGEKINMRRGLGVACAIAAILLINGS